MILSSDEISKACATQTPLLSPFSSSSLRLSSYDLTIGDEFYSGSEISSLLQTQQLELGQSFTIAPHALCFIISEETIRLPATVTAKISLRMSLVYRGLVLTAQPPFDPGYCGKAVVMIHNLSSQAHHLKRGDRLATIEFTLVMGTAAVTHPKIHRSVNNLRSQLLAPVSSSLAEISSATRSTQKRVAWLAGQAVIFAALIVAVLAVPGFYSYTAFAERLSDQKVRADELVRAIEEQKIQNMRLGERVELLEMQSAKDVKVVKVLPAKH